VYTNRHYGNGGSAAANFTARLQANDFVNTTGAGGLNAYLNAIENFNPNNTGDVQRWIPKGLPYDLSDNRDDFNFGASYHDEVSGYTNQQIFNALQSDVRSILVFRDRLLQQNGNNQSVQVNGLINEYHY
ncbi:MAG: hypothetical protein LH615_14600, partial [Ferruginibacter sp.]|nr:hypothetical protein [Ferruginibacter sp.]